MGSLVEINRSSFQLRTILLDVISSPTSHVTYKRYLPSSHKMCFSLAFFQSTVDMQDPIHLWSWSCKDMSLEMTSSHWPQLERSRSTLRESLTDKQKKKRGQLKIILIHSFDKYFLSVTYVPDIVLDAWKIRVNKTDKNNLHLRSSHWRQTLNNMTNKYSTFHVRSKCCRKNRAE